MATKASEFRDSYLSFYHNLQESSPCVQSIRNSLPLGVISKSSEFAEFLEWFMRHDMRMILRWNIAIWDLIDQMAEGWQVSFHRQLAARGIKLLRPDELATQQVPAIAEGEKSGGSVDYYQLPINNPTTEGRDPYIAECNDIIEALGMTFAEGNVFKALWRSCAERELGKKKSGGDAVYDAEKMVFFSQRVLANRRADRATD